MYDEEEVEESTEYGDDGEPLVDDGDDGEEDDD